MQEKPNIGNTNSIGSVYGLRDIDPSALMYREDLKQNIVNYLRNHGYGQILPPLLEPNLTIERGRGDLISQTFQVIDHDGGLLSLRSDITAPIARIAATKLRTQERPLRLCYAASVFRKNISKDLLSREIQQIGAEIYGERTDSSPDSLRTESAECLYLLLSLLKDLGLSDSHTDLHIVFSHNSFWEEYIFRHGNKNQDYKSLYTYLQDGNLYAIKEEYPEIYSIVSKELTGPMEVVLPNIKELLEEDHQIYQQLIQINQLCQLTGSAIPSIDLTYIPDQSFYTGMYFSVLLDTDQIGAGGQYDNLLASYGASEKAFGFALFTEKLINHVQKLHGLGEIPNLQNSHLSTMQQIAQSAPIQ